MSCIGTIAGAVAGLVLASAEPVIVGTDAPFPAYVYLEADGTVSGFERDVMDEVCARAALTCTWQLANFDELIPGVADGRFDVVLGGIAVTEERRRIVDFTTSYHATDPEEWYIGRAGAPPPGRALIGVQSGTVHEAFLRREGLRHLAFPTEGQVLSALASGRIDLALGPFQTRTDLEEMIVGNGFEFLYSDLIHDEGVGMAVCKGNIDLLDTLNAALDSMRADGTLETLENRWFE